MFRHHHPETLAQRIDELMAAVFEPDDHERLAQLAVHLAPGFVYISPSAVVDGAQGLSDAFSHYRHDDWRHTSLRRLSEVDVHHAHFRYDWERQENHVATMRGQSFGWMDGGGLIAQIVSFDGSEPGRPS